MWLGLGILLVSPPVLLLCLIEAPERYSKFFQTLLVRDLMPCTVLLDQEDFFTCHHKLSYFMQK